MSHFDFEKKLVDAENSELLCTAESHYAKSKENAALFDAYIKSFESPNEAKNAQSVLDNCVQVTTDRKDAMESHTKQVISIHKKMVRFVETTSGVDTKTAVEALYRSYNDIDDAIALLG